MKQTILSYIYGRSYLMLFLVSMTVYLVQWLTSPGYTNWYTINGIPFSDAARWYEMARNIADAQPIVGGWSAQRPFYSFTLAVLYQFTGASLSLPILFNIVCASLSVSLVFIIGERIFNDLTGFIASVLFLFNPVIRDILFTITTELYGVMLLLLAIALLIKAIRSDHWSWWFLAGIVLALSEMTRPLALGLLPAIFLLILTLRRSFKSKLVAGSLLFAGFVLILSPWLIRQQIVHDFVGVTDDTFESLYATSSPEFGSWDEWIKEEPEMLKLETVADNIRYFRQGFVFNLKKHPEVYFNNVKHAYHQFLHLPRQYFASPSHAVRLSASILFALMALYLLVVAIVRNRIPRSKYEKPAVVALMSVLSLAIALFAFSYMEFALLISLLVMAYQAYKNEFVRLFILIFLFSGLSLSLVNETNDYRFLVMTYWEHEMIFAFLVSLGAYIIHKYLKVQVFSNGDLLQKYPASRSIIWTLASVALFMTVSLIVIRAKPNPPAVLSSHSLYGAINSQIPEILTTIHKKDSTLIDLTEIAGSYYQDGSITFDRDTLNAGSLAFCVGRIGKLRYTLSGNVQVGHSARLFEERTYDRVVSFEDYFAVVYDRADIALWLDQTVLLINRMNINTNYIQNEERRLLENIAIIPLNEQEEPDLSNMLLAQDPHHRNLLDSLQQLNLYYGQYRQENKGKIMYNRFNILIQ